jgi:hypothetical protein
MAVTRSAGKDPERYVEASGFLAIYEKGNSKLQYEEVVSKSD